MPWPVIWKKPVEMHAARTLAMILSASVELGSERKGAMSTVGT